MYKRQGEIFFIVIFPLIFIPEIPYKVVRIFLAQIMEMCIRDRKESIINNSDCKILLDQRKSLNKFDSIQNLLGLTDKERSQILLSLIHI